jgi:hypothetical protein
MQWLQFRLRFDYTVVCLNRVGYTAIFQLQTAKLLGRARATTTIELQSLSS